MKIIRNLCLGNEHKRFSPFVTGCEDSRITSVQSKTKYKVFKTKLAIAKEKI